MCIRDRVTYRLNESLLELEFNADYSNISRTREILVRAGVARTFLQIPGITGIKIFIGNQELTDSKGQAVGLLDGNTFVEMWGSDKDAYRYDTFTLYFTDKKMCIRDRLECICGAICIMICEIHFGKMKRMGSQIQDAEDEEYHELQYHIEVSSSRCV